MVRSIPEPNPAQSYQEEDRMRKKRKTGPPIPIRGEDLETALDPPGSTPQSTREDKRPPGLLKRKELGRGKGERSVLEFFQLKDSIKKCALSQNKGS